MFLRDEDLDQESITTFFENYVDKGDHIGEKRIYENDICIFTSEKRDKIISKIYRKEDYADYLRLYLRRS